MLGCRVAVTALAKNLITVCRLLLWLSRAMLDRLNYPNKVLGLNAVNTLTSRYDVSRTDLLFVTIAENAAGTDVTLPSEDLAKITDLWRRRVRNLAGCDLKEFPTA